MQAFRLGPRTIDLDAGTVFVDGADPVELTPIEARLLGFLAPRRGEVVTREELLVEVWGYRPGVVSRTIDNTCRRIRTKIEDDPSKPRFLFSVYGRGLRLDGVEPIVVSASDRFVGRQGDLERLARFLADGRRLVTVHGPAGVGKSRIVRELVARLVQRTVHVACGPVADAAGLDAAVGAAVGCAPGASVGRAIAAMGPVLLLLDEGEGCVDTLVQRIPVWSNEAPKLQVIVTSRVILGLPGEQRFGLGPLPTADAVQLFRDRAARNDAAVPESLDLAPIVDGVDGLPLAVELLAARFHLLGIDGLGDEVLRDARATSGVLGAAVERSWRRLEPADRDVLLAACTFVQAFDLDDLAAVAGVSVPQALSHVERLVAQSLLRVVAGRPVRYQPYAIVRDRGRQDLTPALRLRHARWYERLGAPDFLVRMNRESAISDTIVGAVAELRAAVEILLRAPPAPGSDEATTVARCGHALATALAVGGSLRDALEVLDRTERFATEPRLRLWLGRARGTLQLSLGMEARHVDDLLAVAPLATDPDDRARLWATVAAMRRRLGDVDGARAALAEAEVGPRPLGGGLASVLLLRAHLVTPPPEDAHVVRAAVAEAHRAGDRVRESSAAAWLAEQTFVREGDWEMAVRWATRAVQVVGGRADVLARSSALRILGYLHRLRGDLDAAEAAYEEVVGLVPGHVDESIARLDLGRVWLQQGAVDDAAEVAESHLAKPTATADRSPASAALLGALVAVRRGDLAVAERLLRQGMDITTRLKLAGATSELLGWMAAVTGDLTHLDTARALFDGAYARALRTAIAALVHARDGDLDEATTHLDAGQRAVIDLRLLAGSETVALLTEAERTIAQRAGRMVVGPFGR